MISGTDISVDKVASHYDELDDYYRDLWGEHVHHGLWETGREAPELATLQLARLVADRSEAKGKTVCDVGCGYGATSRLLAREYNATVTGLTVSERQHRFATEATNGEDNPTIYLQDWLTNSFEDSSFDSLIAIESLAHMKDKPAFFEQAYRVLRPGGKMVLCVWLTSDHPTRWQTKHLLQPICDEGALPGMGTSDEYLEMARAVGFQMDQFEDLSRKVQKTWSVCIRRGLSAIASQPSYRKLLLDGESSNRVFGLTLFRIWLAFRTGCMLYGLIAGTKPEHPQ